MILFLISNKIKMERIELILDPEFNSFIEYAKHEIEKKSEFLYKYPQFYTLNHLQILEEMLNQDFSDEYIKFEIVYPEDKVSMTLFGLFPKVRIDYAFHSEKPFSQSEKDNTYKKLKKLTNGMR